LPFLANKGAIVESSVNKEDAIAFIRGSSFEFDEESKSMLKDSKKANEEDCSE